MLSGQLYMLSVGCVRNLSSYVDTLRSTSSDYQFALRTLKNFGVIHRLPSATMAVPANLSALSLPGTPACQVSSLIWIPVTTQLEDINLMSDNESNSNVWTDDGSHTTALADEGSNTTVLADEDSITTVLADEGSNTTVLADDGSNTTVLADEGSNTTVLADDDSNTTVLAEDGSHTTALADEDSNTTALADKDSNTTIIADEGLNTTVLTDDDSITTVLADEEGSNTTVLIDDGPDFAVFTEDELNTTVLIADISNTTVWTEHMSNTSTFTDSATNITVLTDDSPDIAVFTEDELNTTVLIADMSNTTVWTEHMSNTSTFTDSATNITVLTDDSPDIAVFTEDELNTTVLIADMSNTTVWTEHMSNTSILTDSAINTTALTNDGATNTTVPEETEYSTTSASSVLPQSTTSKADYTVDCSKYAVQSTAKPAVQLKVEPLCTESGSVLDQLTRFIGYQFPKHKCGNPSSTAKFVEILYCSMLNTHTMCMQPFVDELKYINTETVPQISTVKKIIEALCSMDRFIAKDCLFKRLKYVTRCVKAEVESILSFQNKRWAYGAIDQCRAVGMLCCDLQLCCNIRAFHQNTSNFNNLLVAFYDMLKQQHLEVKVMCMWENVLPCNERTAGSMAGLIGQHFRSDTCTLSGCQHVLSSTWVPLIIITCTQVLLLLIMGHT